MQNIIIIVILYIAISIVFKMIKPKKKRNYKRYEKKNYKKRQRSKDIGIEKKTTKEKYRENKERGTEYEEQVGECYEDENYKVIYRGIEKGKKDGGIDLIATAGDEILLIQCKNWKSAPKQIRIKEFIYNCDKYIQENNLKNYKIRKIFACSYPRIDYGVKKFLNENKNIIEYKIIPYIEV